MKVSWKIYNGNKMEESNNFLFNERSSEKLIRRVPPLGNLYHNGLRLPHIGPAPTQCLRFNYPLESSNLYGNYQVHFRESVPFMTYSSTPYPPVSSFDMMDIPKDPHIAANTKVQFIENLVGNRASDQSGTYSQFGTPLNGLGMEFIDNTILDQEKKNVFSKTRISPDVRPKRPSYSDVLANSIASNCRKINPKKPQVIQQSVNQNIFNEANIKTKPTRWSLNGNSNVLNKLTFGESGKNGAKDINQRLKEESLSQKPTKHWKKNINYNDEKNKKNFSKVTKHTVPNKVDSKTDITLTKSQGSTNINAPSTINLTDDVGNEYKRRKIQKWKFYDIKPNNCGLTWPINDQYKRTYENKKSKKQKMACSQKRKSLKENFEEGTFVRNSKYESFSNKKMEEKRVSWNNQKLSRKYSRNLQSEKQEKIVRMSRREQKACISTVIKVQIERSGGVLLFALNWLIWLVLDVIFLSTYLTFYMCASAWAYFVVNVSQIYKNFCNSIKNIEFLQRISTSIFCTFRKSYLKKLLFDGLMKDQEKSVKGKISAKIKQNITLPETGIEAIKRLLACKEEDAYSVMGVTPNCSDGEIKKYYNWQASLVHPDKNKHEGAEEAFKILARAFTLIGHPEKRKCYDRRFGKVGETEKILDRFDNMIQKKEELFANTMKCTNCRKRHKRIAVNRPLYAARMCRQCKIHHSVREGDIWAETSMFGLLWRYYACMEGKVYDVTEWAGCQKKNLKNFKANTHNVQYKMIKLVWFERLDFEC